MFDTVTLWKYGGVLVALLASGFGAPIPEEIPVVTAGAMVGHDAQEVADYAALVDAADDAAAQVEWTAAVAGGTALHLRPARPDRPAHLTRWWIMLPVIIVGVVVGDMCIFLVGRYGGRRLLDWPWFQRRVLPPDKQAKIAANFAKNGILILLGARLTPGIRTPVFLMAGVLRMPLSRFLLADALYAVPGVNLLFWLAYVFTDQFVAAMHAVEPYRGTAITFVAGAVVGAAATKFLSGRKLATGDPADIPTVVKPVGAVTQAVEQAIETTVGKTVATAAMVVDKVMHPHGGGAVRPDGPPHDPTPVETAKPGPPPA